DSAAFVNLAKVGKGRALLGLGEFADAATAVQGVPTDFAYLTRFNSSVVINFIGNKPQVLQALDGEGTNGLAWSTDPRAAITTTTAQSGAMKLSAKYSVSGGTLNAAVAAPLTPVRVADGLEARLIEAEAQLAAGGSAWLATLNTLRATCVGA